MSLSAVKSSIFAVFVVFFVFFISTSALAEERFWVGGAGASLAATSSWSSVEGSLCTENTGASVPGFDDVMIFDSACVNSSATSTNGIHVKGIEMRSGYTGTVRMGTTYVVGPSGFNQAGGTFNAGTRHAFIIGDFTLTGGVYNASTFRTTINGNFDVQGGTFNHNGGSVDLSYGASSTLGTLPILNDLHITDGLLGRWKMDEGSGTTVFDSSGMATPFHGTTTVGQHDWVSDAPNLDFLGSSTLQFSGTSGIRITAGTNVNRFSLAPGEMTVSAWVKVSSTTMGIIAANDYTGNNNLWLLQAMNGKFQFRTKSCGNNSATSCLQSGGTTVNVQIESDSHELDEWVHVAGTKTRDLMTLYVNGVAEVSSTSPQYFTHPNSPFCIGSRSNGTNCDSSPFRGNIADVRVYNRALSATEIAALANGQEYAAGTNISIAHTLSSDLEVVGNLSISHAILNLNGHNLTLGATSTIGSKGVLRLQGGETLTNFINATTTGVVEYSGSGSYNSLIAGDEYYDLVFNGSGDWTLDGDLAVRSSLTLLAGDFIQSTHSLSLANDLTIASGASFIKSSDGSAVTISGSSTISDLNATKQNIGNVVLSSAAVALASGVKAESINIPIDSQLTTHGYNLDITDDLTIGGTLDATSDQANNSVITLGGDWLMSGVFTADNSTVVFSSSSQSIEGVTTFYNFTKQASGVDTLTFPVGAIQTISGTLILRGVSESERLSLRSVTPGSSWRINPQGVVDVAYVDVQDSTNLAKRPIEYTSNSLNSGNNINWYLLKNDNSGSRNSSITDGSEPVSDLVSQIIARINELKSQLSILGKTTLNQKPSIRPIFTRTLSLGMEGQDVMELQKLLNRLGFSVAISGPGSAGAETTFFGRLTTMALTRLQEAYAQEILTPVGLSVGTGIFGPATKAWVDGRLAGDLPNL